MFLPSLVFGILFRSWHMLGKHSTAELHGQNPISIISLILTVVWILLHTCALVCVEVRRQLLGVGPGPTPECLGLELGSWDLEMCFKLTSPVARCQKFKVLLLQQIAPEVVILLSCLFMNWDYKPGYASVK